MFVSTSMSNNETLRNSILTCLNLHGVTWKAKRESKCKIYAHTHARTCSQNVTYTPEYTISHEVSYLWFSFNTAPNFCPDAKISFSTFCTSVECRLSWSRASVLLARSFSLSRVWEQNNKTKHEPNFSWTSSLKGGVVLSKGDGLYLRTSHLLHISLCSLYWSLQTRLFVFKVCNKWDTTLPMSTRDKEALERQISVVWVLWEKDFISSAVFWREYQLYFNMNRPGIFTKSPNNVHMTFSQQKTGSASSLWKQICSPEQAQWIQIWRETQGLAQSYRQCSSSWSRTLPFFLWIESQGPWKQAADWTKRRNKGNVSPTLENSMTRNIFTKKTWFYNGTWEVGSYRFILNDLFLLVSFFF